MNVTVKDICNIIEEFAPLAFQESYDNSGLIIGDANSLVSGVLVTLDVVEDTITEAIEQGYNMIVAHHPLIFGGIKKIVGQSYVQRCISKAIKNNIAIYAAHTNLDNVIGGVNWSLANKLKLTNLKILQPKTNLLSKLIVYTPQEHIETVKNAIFAAGAGVIGNYDCCSFSSEGKGTFRAGKGSKPFVGEQNQIHIETESRIEIIVPNHIMSSAVVAMHNAHPYEEPAFDIYPLDIKWKNVGTGVIGTVTEAIEERDFLQFLKDKLQLSVIKHTKLLNKKIEKVAICGGSGSDFLQDAIQQKADIYISADFKYHQYFDAENRIIIADIGHFESEQHTKEIFYNIITKKIANFAVKISDINTNPTYYF